MTVPSARRSHGGPAPSWRSSASGDALLAAQLGRHLVEQRGQLAALLAPAQPERQLAGGPVELEVVGEVGPEQSRGVGAVHPGGDSPDGTREPGSAP